WRIEAADSGLSRIGSIISDRMYFHLEQSKGYTEYGVIYPVWNSAKWSIEKVVVYDEKRIPLIFADDTPTESLTTKRGAAVPWTTYEAEDGSTANSTVLLEGSIKIGTPSGEASGRKAVELYQKDDYVEWKIIKPANALVIRLSVPDAEDGGGGDYTLSIYKNGKHLQDLPVTSKYAWLYGNEDQPTNNPADGAPRRIYDESRTLLTESLAVGDVIRLQKDDADTAKFYHIDFIELEQVTPINQPENSYSITDFGADGTDTKDDTTAIQNCITAAKAQGKTVWIPEGTFYQSRKLTVENITIQGSGVWYSVLFGYTSGNSMEGTGFDVSGDNTKFYNFSVIGEATIRGTGGNGFDGIFGIGSELHNIWVEHTNCGVWEGKDYSVNMGTKLVFEGCRFRNTFADGINLCNGTQNSVIRNCNTRNTGDDGIAIWSEGQFTLRSSYNNIIENCTAQLPWRAAGIAIYGGDSNIVQNNVVTDTMTYPGLTISSGFKAKPFTGATLIRYNDLIRCGGTFWKEQQFGAIWIQAGDTDITGDIKFLGNDIYDASYSAIHIQCERGRIIGGNIIFDDLDIKGTGTFGIFVKGNSTGAATFRNTGMSNIGSMDAVFNNAKNTFEIKKDNGNSGW
ncbi:MAG: coagulation factor 5/8 type domain protein, partial [Herbinix sp.]|nr:coagulation factor 5/8 type domain protein [Herbinix sp.]